jgi:type I restriction enzyme S subunit
LSAIPFLRASLPVYILPEKTSEEIPSFKDFKGNCPRFINYFLKTIDFHSFSDKAAVPGINRNHLHQAMVEIPDLPIQKFIVNCLSSLDDQVRVLREINLSLEMIMQTLFKSWFIDFDPVFRKPQHGFSKELAKIAALFPDNFKDSKMGKIPDGWTVCNINEAIVFHEGKTWENNERVDFSEVKVFGANGSVGYSNKTLGEGRVIFLGKIGSCGAINFFNGKWWATNNCFYIQQRDNPNLEWCRQVLCKVNFKSYIGGASNPYMPLKNFSHYQIVKPPDNILKAFQDFCIPLRGKIEFNESIIETILKIRDDLLRPLLFGKLTMPSNKREGVIA